MVDLLSSFGALIVFIGFVYLYLNGKTDDVPEIIANDEAAKKRLLDQCPSLKMYRPPFIWGTSGNLQTMYSLIVRRSAPASFTSHPRACDVRSLQEIDIFLSSVPLKNVDRLRDLLITAGLDTIEYLRCLADLPIEEAEGFMQSVGFSRFEILLVNLQLKKHFA